MKKTYKIVPFDIELAKKIQAGEIEGKIKDNTGFEVTIVSFNGVNTPLPIVVKSSFTGGDNIFFVGKDGVSTHIVLVLEVPDNEPEQPQFKPFDKVLVRDDNRGIWRVNFFSHRLDDLYVCVGDSWRQCIPYEGNEHLVGR